MAEDGAKVLEAYIEVSGKTEDAEKSIDDLKKKVKEVHPEVKKLGEGLEGLIKSVKADYGKRSVLGELVETIKGGAAIAGIAVLGEALAGATERAAEFADEFRAGKIGAAAMAESVAESLPIISSFAEAGHNLAEIFTGAKQAAEQYNETISHGNELFEQQQKIKESLANVAYQGEVRKDGALGERYIAESKPGIDRNVASRQVDFETKKASLLHETSDEQNEKRMEDAKAETARDANKEFAAAKLPVSIDERTGAMSGTLVGNDAEIQRQQAEVDKINTAYMQKRTAAQKTIADQWAAAP